MRRARGEREREREIEREMPKKKEGEGESGLAAVGERRRGRMAGWLVCVGRKNM